MSTVKKGFLAAVLFVCAIMAGYLIQIQFYGDPLKREPSSVESVHLKTIKMEKLNPESKNHPVHTNKLRGPVNISIQALEEGPKQQGDVYRLRLIVEASVHLDFLDYKWSVPAGVEVISGDLNGQFHNLEAGQVQYVDVDFRSLSGKNEQIHALISKQMDGYEFAEVAQFNTVFETYLGRDKSETLNGDDGGGESLDDAVDQQFKVFE